MGQSTDQKMVADLEEALREGHGLVAVEVDGTKVQYNRAQALKELAHYRRRVARAAGTRPAAASINLAGF